MTDTLMPDTASDGNPALESLRGELDTLCQHYDRQFRELYALEKRVNAFLDAYLQQVGGYFSSVPGAPAAPGGRVAANENIAPAAQKLEPIALPDVREAPASTELKRLHRRLIKQCHPDSARQTLATNTIMTRIQEAYAQKSLAAMLRMYHYILLREMPDDAALYGALATYRNELREASASLKSDYDTLLASPEYRLMRNYEYMQAEGKNLVEEVIARMEENTAASQPAGTPSPASASRTSDKEELA